MIDRKIIHVDCDCFYAAVEMRDYPAYRGIPIAVGGSADSRGVIATCNYLAREFGVHSAMPSSRAMRLCPNLIIIPGRMAFYREISAQIMAIFRRYTDLVEPLSLDEAYLDVTDAALASGSATSIAERIQDEVAKEIGITVSVGIAPNKFIAKVASDWRKPNGLFVVKPDTLDAFAAVLPVSKIPGVGPVITKRMAALDIKTCADLRLYSEEQLSQMFGRLGESLAKRRYGLDNRPLQTHRVRKSVSVETTFSSDMRLQRISQKHLPELMKKLQIRWQKLEQQYVISGQVVKLKFKDFTQLTREQVGKDIHMENYLRLLNQAYISGSPSQQCGGARLVGLGLKLRQRESLRQLCLF